MAVVFALLSSALWGTADFFGGVFTKRMHAVVVVLVSQAIALLVIIPTAYLAGAFDDPTGYFWWAVLCGVVGPIGLVSFYMALSIGTMGVVSPIASTGIVIPVIWGLVDGDRPSTLQIVGILLAFAGVLSASGPDVHGDDHHARAAHVRSIGLALLAALGFGMAFVCLDAGGAYSVGMTIVVQRSTSVLLLVIPVIVFTRMRGLRRKDVLGLAGVGLGDAGANGAFALSSTMGLLSVTAVLASLYPVATLVLARFLLHERLTRLQGYGVTLALAGVVLLAAG